MMRPIEIQIMSSEQRNQIAQQLAKAEARFSAGGASPIPKTTLEIAQTRIEVFVKKQLWSDALQELNSVDLPTAERQALTQEAIGQWSDQREKITELTSRFPKVKLN